MYLVADAFVVFAAVAVILSGFSATAQEPAKKTDTLRSLDFSQVEIGGEIGRRIKITVENSLLNLDIDELFLNRFTEKQTKKGKAAGPVWNRRGYKKTAQTGLTSSREDILLPSPRNKSRCAESLQQVQGFGERG